MTTHSKGKEVKVWFYIALYPVRWTAQSALHFPPLADLFIPTPFSASLGSILAMQQLRNDYSLTFPPLSIARYYSSQSTATVANRKQWPTSDAGYSMSPVPLKTSTRHRAGKGVCQEVAIHCVRTREKKTNTNLGCCDNDGPVYVCSLHVGDDTQVFV